MHSYDDWWSRYTKVNHLDPGTRWRKELIVPYLAKQSIKTIVDLGCGSGELLQYLHDRYPDKRLSGVDVSKKALDILAQRRLAKKLYRVDLEKARSISGKYDAIVCSEVIEHLENWKNVFTIISRISKKGTIVVLTTQSGRIYPHNKKMGHLKHFTIDEITEELTKEGFQIVQANYSGWPFMNIKNIMITYILRNADYGKNYVYPFLGLSLKVFYLLYRLSNTGLGPQILVVGVKNK